MTSWKNSKLMSFDSQNHHVKTHFNDQLVVLLREVSVLSTSVPFSWKACDSRCSFLCSMLVFKSMNTCLPANIWASFNIDFSKSNFGASGQVVSSAEAFAGQSCLTNYKFYRTLHAYVLYAWGLFQDEVHDLFLRPCCSRWSLPFRTASHTSQSLY